MRVLILSLLALVGTACADPASFQVGGAVQNPAAWTASDLRARLGSQAKTLYYKYRGADHSAQCVLLWSLVQAAGPTVTRLLASTVQVEGSDGYRVSFSLGELSPDFGNEGVWLALDEDAAPLPADLGPSRLVIPADVKLGRWVHNITRVTV